MRGIYWSKQWKNHTYIYILLLFMVSFKTINKNKSNYKVVVCLCQKDFLLLWRHHLQMWLPQLSLQHRNLIMELFCFLRWFYVSAIHLAWRGFISLNLRDTFTLFAHSISIGPIQKVRSLRRGGGSLKSELKRTGGGGGPGMCVSSLFYKNAEIFKMKF